MKPCCDALECAIKGDYIELRDGAYYIHEIALFATYDVVWTEKVQIYYCPFCGSEMEKESDGK